MNGNTLNNRSQYSATVPTFVVMLVMTLMSATALAQKAENSGSINLMEKHKAEYTATEDPATITIGPANYLVCDGKGAPGGPEFGQRIQALYGVAYSIKMSKQMQGKSFEVGALEAQWWGNKDPYKFTNEPQETWNWKLYIRVPDFVTQKDVDGMAQNMGGNEVYKAIKIEKTKQLKCVHILHKGPYEEEQPSIDKLEAFAKTNNLVQNGYHHEIYLNNPNSVPPAELRTIIRLPVKPKK